MQEAQQFIDFRPRRYQYGEKGFNKPTVVDSVKLSSSEDEDEEETIFSNSMDSQSGSDEAEANNGADND